MVFEELFEEGTDGGDAAQVVGEDEEADEGEEQTVVHAAQGGAVEEQREGRDQAEEPGVGEEAENGQQTEHEESAAEEDFAGMGQRAVVFEAEVDGFIAQDVGEGKEEERAAEGHRHRGGKEGFGGDGPCLFPGSGCCCGG